MLAKCPYGMVVLFRHGLERKHFELYCLISFSCDTAIALRGLINMFHLLDWKIMLFYVFAMTIQSHKLQVSFCYLAKIDEEYRYRIFFSSTRKTKNKSYKEEDEESARLLSVQNRSSSSEYLE